VEAKFAPGEDLVVGFVAQTPGTIRPGICRVIDAIVNRSIIDCRGLSALSMILTRDFSITFLAEGRRSQFAFAQHPGANRR